MEPGREEPARVHNPPGCFWAGPRCHGEGLAWLAQNSEGGGAGNADDSEPRPSSTSSPIDRPGKRMDLTQRSSRFGVRQFVAKVQNLVHRPILTAVTLTVLSVGCVSSGSAQNAQPAPVAPPAAGQAQQPLTVSKADIPHTILITGELRAARSRDLTVPNIRTGFASTVTYL